MERREPPEGALSQLYGDTAGSPTLTKPGRQNHLAHLRQLLGSDTQLSKYIVDPSEFEVARDDPLPRLDRIYDSPLEIGVRDFSQGPALRVIKPPYDYSDHDRGNARMNQDHITGKMGIGADAGNVEDVDDNHQEGKCWIGVGLYSSQTINVRISPLIYWRSQWHIDLAGSAPLFIKAPWVQWDASVETQAYNESGHVSPLLTESLVHARKLDAPGGLSTSHGFDAGVPSAMHTFITIPAGTTRWFNTLAHGDARADYTGLINSASLQAGMDVEVALIVVERV